MLVNNGKFAMIIPDEYQGLITTATDKQRELFEKIVQKLMMLIIYGYNIEGPKTLEIATNNMLKFGQELGKLLKYSEAENKEINTPDIYTVMIMVLEDMTNLSRLTAQQKTEILSLQRELSETQLEKVCYSCKCELKPFLPEIS